MSYIIEITRALRANDTYITADRLTSLLFATLQSDQIVDINDGYRILRLSDAVRDGLLADFVEPESPTNFEYIVDTLKQGGVAARTSYATKALVQSAIALLDDSDGYSIFASWDNDGGGKRFESRITLWRWTPTDIDTGSPVPEVSQVNNHSRTDEDRF